jgi:hypothetical protein
MDDDGGIRKGRAGPGGIETRPPCATFESEVQMTGAGTFIESGRISYGKAGGVTFIQTRRSSVSCPSASQKPPY